MKQDCQRFDNDPTLMLSLNTFQVLANFTVYRGARASVISYHTCASMSVDLMEIYAAKSNPYKIFIEIALLHSALAFKVIYFQVEYHVRM